MAEDDSGSTHQQHGNLSEVTRHIDIELFALATGINKQQALELLKKYGEDHETLVRRAWHTVNKDDGAIRSPADLGAERKRLTPSAH